MDETKGKFQYAGLKFLYDMEIVDDPQLLNNMKLNIFSVSPSIKEIEFLASYPHRSILVWLEISWFGKKFLEKRIIAGVTDRVQQLLPNFRFRVTTDRRIFDLALARMKTVLKGESNEKVPSSTGNAVDSKPGVSDGTQSPTKEPDPKRDPETKS